MGLLALVACDPQARTPRSVFEGIVGEPLVDGDTVSIAIDQPHVDLHVVHDGQALQLLVNGREFVLDAVTVVAVESLDPTASLDVAAHGAVDLDGDQHELEITGSGYVLQLEGFRHQTITAVDTDLAEANLIGSAGSEDVLVMPDYAKVEGHGYSVTLEGFAFVTVDGYGGRDAIKAYDSPGDDQFGASPDRSTIVFSNGFSLELFAFEDVVVIGSGGNDTGTIVGTDGVDLYGGNQVESRLVAREQAFDVWYHGIPRIDVWGGLGDDEAEIWDSAGDDTLVVDAYDSELTASSFGIAVTAFDLVRVHGSAGGHNRVETLATPAYTLELDGFE
jgi:hypothetical protein